MKIKLLALFSLVFVFLFACSNPSSSGGGPELSYTGKTLCAGTEGVAYSQDLATATGADGINYLLASGSLPQGLSLSQAGLLSGTPVDITTNAAFSVLASAEGLSATADFTVTIKPVPGTGTPSTDWYDAGDSYIISNPDDLAGLEFLVRTITDFNGKTIKLAANLDMSAYGQAFNGGKGWRPIGNWDEHFKGEFDGNNKAIIGLYFNDDSFTSPGGLFGYIEGGIIKDLGMKDVDITSDSIIGGLAGQIGASKISNCYVTGAVSGGTFYNGGLVGSIFNGEISNCYVTGAVSGKSEVGGLVGHIENGEISNCYATGAVSGIYEVGGLVGSIDNSEISNCYATGAVSCEDADVGGLVGNILGGAISNCYATGAVSGKSDVGGLVGYIRDSNIRFCAALNPGLTRKAESTETSFCRVAGNVVGDSLGANVAFAGMMPPDDIIFDDKFLYGHDGADISKAQITGEIFGYFTAAGGWTTGSGVLPGFGQTVALPGHLR